MPYKRNNKIVYRKKIARAFKKAAKKFNKGKRYQPKRDRMERRLVVPNSTSVKMPVAERLLVKFPMEFQFYIISNGGGNVHNLTEVDLCDLNALTQPFAMAAANGSNPASTLQIGSGVATSIATSFTLLQNPIGFSRYMSQTNVGAGLYRNYCVKGCKITAEIATQSIIDAGTVVLFPFNPNTVLQSNTMAQAAGRPFSIVKEITSGKGTIKISKYVAVHDLIGLTRQEFDICSKAYLYNYGGNTAGSETISPYAGSYLQAPVNLWRWRMIWLQADNAAGTGPNSPILVRLKLTWYTELSNVAYEDLPIT